MSTSFGDGVGHLGTRLRAAGLTPRALAAWAGTDLVTALPARLPGLATPEPLPAAAALALFVAGAEVVVDRLRALPIDELIAADLVARAGDRVRARVAILPVGTEHSPGLVVCDRHDAPTTSQLVCWPDDSSQHLAKAIPAHRVAHWLDLGCGSAYAALARPGVAARITGVELNPRAVAYSRLGATLSGIAHLAIVHGDLAVAQPPAALVTCNAPMPTLATDPDGNVMWRHTEDDLFARLVAVIPARVAPGGLAVVHAALSAIPLDALPGERRVVAYTPPGAVPGFGVLWWRPDAPARLSITHRALTPERPHLDARDGESC